MIKISRIAARVSSGIRHTLPAKARSLALGLAFTPKEFIDIHSIKGDQPMDYAVSTYRLVAFGATVTSAALMAASARREGIDPNNSVKAFFWGALGGVVGAWGLYYFGEIDPASRMDFVSGILSNPPGPGQSEFFGYSWYGGLLASVPTMMAYAWIKKIPIGKFLDALAPVGLTFHALLRLACFYSGDSCWGSATDVPWGFDLGHGFLQHATPLYHTITDLASAGFIWLMARGKRFTGQLFFSALGLHSLGRFIIEFWRQNPELGNTGLTSYQLCSLGLFSLSTAILAYLGARSGRNHNG